VKPRALVVDDEPSLVFTLQLILESNGFEVETANSSQEARRKLDTATFQIVVTDLRMETPRAGEDVIRCAKAKPNRPVAVLHTAYPVPELEWKSWGADALFEKPVNSVNAMAKKLKLLLEKREAGADSTE
jgi:CheY-like chemotaxis protein